MNFEFDFLFDDEENHHQRSVKFYKIRRTVRDDDYRKLFRVPDLVAACCVLHNIATYLKEEQFEGDADEVDEEDEEVAVNDVADRARGVIRRDAIANSILQMQ